MNIASRLIRLLTFQATKPSSSLDGLVLNLHSYYVMSILIPVFALMVGLLSPPLIISIGMLVVELILVFTEIMLQTIIHNLELEILS